MFLFLPLLPLLGGSDQRRIKECPSCGWTTDGDEKYCPYCAVLLLDKKD